MKPPAIVAITGASVGIGAAIARRFAKANYHLVLLSRRQERLEALRKELGPDRVDYLALDVTQRQQVKQTFDQIEKKIGPIDILVNNAGGAFGLDRAQNADLDEWEKCVDLNIKGVLYCTHAVLPHMVARDRGHVINLGSVAGHYPYPGGSVYCGVKAFIHQFSLCVKADLLGTQVRISCIEPGLLGGTEFSLTRFRGDATKAASVYERTEPLQAEDAAEAIYFCCTAPERVNINSIELMPTAQAFSSLSIHRT